MSTCGERVKAPLINLPFYPWSRVAIDVVGPLNDCKDKVPGSRILVTISHLATHFPLAYPVKTHTAVEVAKCLKHAFTLFGFPKKILSNQGSEFVSQVLEVFLKECNVKHLLKRFHRCLNNMLKVVLHDNPGLSGRMFSLGIICL